MSEDFNCAHHKMALEGVTLHYVTAGSGDPLVPLHGWPQTWYEWRRVVPALAQRYTVIAPDSAAWAIPHGLHPAMINRRSQLTSGN